MGTFRERTQQLEAQVGYGEIKGRVVVDQVYAQDQHESVWYKHPTGGNAKYLSSPLFGNHDLYYARLARNVLHGSLVKGMIENMEDLSNEVHSEAPWEFSDLRASGHPIVFDRDVVVYDRPPRVHRLTQSELDAKDDLRSLGLGHN
jgi:hypothetical protein